MKVSPKPYVTDSTHSLILAKKKALELHQATKNPDEIKKYKGLTIRKCKKLLPMTKELGMARIYNNPPRRELPGAKLDHLWDSPLILPLSRLMWMES